jgi:hypothetical protein
VASAPTDTSPPAEQQALPDVGPLEGPPAAAAPPAATRLCASCGTPMQDGQDWCLICGAGSSGSLQRRGSRWRAPGILAAATALLVLGAGAAGYAALTKGSGHRRVVRAYVAQSALPAAPATPPATPPPAAPSIPGAAATPTTPSASTASKIPLFGKATPPSKVKVPSIKIPKSVSVTPSVGLLGGTTHIPTTIGKTRPSKGSSGESGPGPSPEAMVLDTDAASTYNPYAYPAGEFGDPSRAIDGDKTTEWTAQVNPTAAPKTAEGLVIDLKTLARTSAALLVTSTPGMTIQFYGATGAAPPTSITDPAWVKLSPSLVEKKRHLRVTLKHAKSKFRFIVLWISRAPASAVGTPQAPGHVSVSELELFPPA